MSDYATSFLSKAFKQGSDEKDLIKFLCLDTYEAIEKLDPQGVQDFARRLLADGTDAHAFLNWMRVSASYGDSVLGYEKFTAGLKGPSLRRVKLSEGMISRKCAAQLSTVHKCLTQLFSDWKAIGAIAATAQRSSTLMMLARLIPELRATIGDDAIHVIFYQPTASDPESAYTFLCELAFYSTEPQDGLLLFRWPTTPMATAPVTVEDRIPTFALPQAQPATVEDRIPTPIHAVNLELPSIENLIEELGRLYVRVDLFSVPLNQLRLYIYSGDTDDNPGLSQLYFIFDRLAWLYEHDSDCPRKLMQYLEGRSIEFPGHNFYSWLKLGLSDEGALFADADFLESWKFARRKGILFTTVDHRRSNAICGVIGIFKSQIASVKLICSETRLQTACAHLESFVLPALLKNLDPSHGVSISQGFGGLLEHESIKWIESENLEFPGAPLEVNDTNSAYIDGYHTLATVCKHIRRIVQSRETGPPLNDNRNSSDRGYSSRSAVLAEGLRELAALFVKQVSFTGLPVSQQNLRVFACVVPAMLFRMKSMHFKCLEIIKEALLLSGSKADEKSIDSFLVFLGKAAASRNLDVLLQRDGASIEVSTRAVEVPVERLSTAPGDRVLIRHPFTGDESYTSPRFENISFLNGMLQNLEQENSVTVYSGMQETMETEQKTLKGIEAHWVSKSLLFTETNPDLDPGVDSITQPTLRLRSNWTIYFNCRLSYAVGRTCPATGEGHVTLDDVTRAARISGKLDLLSAATAPKLLLEFIEEYDVPMRFVVVKDPPSKDVDACMKCLHKRYIFGGHIHAEDQNEVRKPIFPMLRDSWWQDLIKKKLASGNYKDDKIGRNVLHEEFLNNYGPIGFPWDTDYFNRAMPKILKKLDKSAPVNSDSLEKQKTQSNFISFDEIATDGKFTTAGMKIALDTPIQMNLGSGDTQYQLFTSKKQMILGSLSPVLHIDGTWGILRQDKVVISICTQTSENSVIPIATGIAPCEFAEDFGYILNMFNHLCVTLLGYLPNVRVVMADGILRLDKVLEKVYPESVYKRKVSRGMCYWHLLDNLRKKNTRLRPDSQLLGLMFEVVMLMSSAVNQCEFEAIWSVYYDKLHRKYVAADSRGILPSLSDRNDRMLKYFQGYYVYHDSLCRWYFGAFQRIYPQLGIWINRTNNPCESYNNTMKKLLDAGGQITDATFGFWMKSVCIKSNLGSIDHKIFPNCSPTAEICKRLKASCQESFGSKPIPEHLYAASEKWYRNIEHHFKKHGVAALLREKNRKPDARCFMLEKSGVLRPFHDAAEPGFNFENFHENCKDDYFRVSFCDLAGYQGRAGSIPVQSWTLGRCSCRSWWTERCCEHVIAIFRHCTNMELNPVTPERLKLILSDMKKQSNLIDLLKKGVTPAVELCDDQLRLDEIEAASDMQEPKRAAELGMTSDLLKCWKEHLNNWRGCDETRCDAVTREQIP